MIKIIVINWYLKTKKKKRNKKKKKPTLLDIVDRDTKLSNYQNNNNNKIYHTYLIEVKIIFISLILWFIFNQKKKNLWFILNISCIN